MTKEDAINRAKGINALLREGEPELLWDLAMKYVKEGGIAIEIGSWLGGSAVIIGEVCKQKNARLFCIDGFSGDMHHYAQLSTDQITKFINNTRDLPISLLTGNSLEISSFVQDGIADFVFIDGDHQYEPVKTDIINFRKKLAKEGVLLGHDYVSMEQGFSIQPVKTAVDELLGAENIKVVGTTWIYEWKLQV